MVFTIKFAYQEDIRRFSFEKAPSFGEVKDLTLKTFFAKANDTTFVLKYKDDEGDVCSIYTDRELSEALRLAPKNCLRVDVVVTQSKPSQSQDKGNNYKTERPSIREDLYFLLCYSKEKFIRL